MKMYKRFKAHFAPLLAALFTAIGRLKKVPKRFLNSVITVLHKKGSKLERSNYRPISLTNTDYRLVARVLAGRLGPILQNVIDPAQTAFLKGRHIGDNAMLLQVLPAWLQQQQRFALVAFCDFRKAYDTIDRKFLFKVAETLGLGDGFLAWLKMLLTDTRSAAIIEGYLSDYRRFEAGVRQGCPLAPLLYLLVAQAALSWLRSQEIGIRVESQLITAAQFADDLKVLLDGPQQIPAFVEAMSVFAAASGQHMLPEKTKLLPIGKPPTSPLPRTIHGLPVVSSVTALGLQFSSFSGEVSADWPALIESVHGRVEKIVKSRLSPFGRAFAVNGYALSRILFHTQFVGLPPHSWMKYLERLTAAAVDREICLRMPGQTGVSQKRFTHVSKELLVGHPARGGFGLLPLKEHVTARMAWWACRFLTGPEATPWICIGRAVLAHIVARSGSPSTRRYPTPRLHFLCAAGQGLAAYFGIPNGAVPAVLNRMAAALATLPRPQIFATLPPGPWCAHVPLWSNPLLLEAQSLPLERSSLDITLLAGRGLTTLGDLLRTRMELESMNSLEFSHVWHSLTFAGRPEGCPLNAIPPGVFRVLRTRDAVRGLLDKVVMEVYERLPAGWFDAAQSPGSSSTAAAEELILSSLGWQLQQRKFLLGSVTVKAGTLLQLQRKPLVHLPKLVEFAALISSETPVSQVQKMLSRMWSRPCEGRILAPLWILVLNGIPSAERLDCLTTQQCGCGAHVGPNRVHLYHECPILQPLLESIAAQFSEEWAVISPLQRHHLWLAVKPHPNLHQGIWDFVILYLIFAFDNARRNWTDRVLKHAQNRGQPSRSSRTAGSGHRPAMAAGSAMVASVSKVVQTEFQAGLADLIALNTLPKEWLNSVPLDHPFIRPDSERQIWQISLLE